MKKAVDKRDHFALITGVVLLVIAASIIFLAVFLPRLREKRALNERVELLLSADYTLVLLSDPLYKTGDVIVDRGVEVALTDEEIVTARQKLSAVIEGGLKNKENISEIEGAWDVRLQIRTADGTRTELYFTETTLYFCEEGTAFYFEPKNQSAHEELYLFFEATLASHA